MTALRTYPVLGPPGAGKTTALIWLDQRHRCLARFAVREYGLFLAEAGHPLGIKVRDSLLRGELLPDDLVQQEFAHFLDALPGDVTAVAVEGYPRDPRQCADLEQTVCAAGGRVAGLIVIDIPEDVVWTRVAGRRICAGCGLPVTVTGGICPACGGEAARREDDAAERLARRLDDFRTISAEVRSYFEQRRLLRVVDGLRSPDEVRGSLEALLLSDPAR